MAEVPSRLARPDLPLVAGKGANDHVPEALDILEAADSLKDRMRGLVRMGERRWDILLDRDQRILLPVENPVQALERVIALGEAQELFERDLVAIDMRLAQRPTIRMTEAAHENWWKIRQFDGGGQ